MNCDAGGELRVGHLRDRDAGQSGPGVVDGNRVNAVFGFS